MSVQGPDRNEPVPGVLDASELARGANDWPWFRSDTLCVHACLVLCTVRCCGAQHVFGANSCLARFLLARFQLMFLKKSLQAADIDAGRTMPPNISLAHNARTRTWLQVYSAGPSAA
jgi:hypothetical protein